MHRLFFSIKRVHWLWDRKCREVLRCDEGPIVTPSQWLLLRTLYTYRQGLVRFKLAGLLGVAASGVSRMVKLLEDDDLVERSRPYKDKRLVRVKLTPIGEGLVEYLLRNRYREPVDDFAERNAEEWFASTELPDVELAVLDDFLIRARVRQCETAIYPVPWYGGEILYGWAGTIQEPPPTRFRVAA